MTYLSFTSRSTYFAARAEWKADYFKLSAEIREARANYRKACQEYSKGSGLLATQNGTMRTRDALRTQARELLETLDTMKVEAAHQWEAEHDKSVH